MDEFDPESIPSEFWEILEALKTDPAQVANLNLGKLVRFLWSYCVARTELTEDPYEHYIRSESRDTILTIIEWVIDQGRAYYLDVYRNPSKIPAEEPVERYCGLVHVAFKEYVRRYDKDPPDAPEDWPVGG